MLHKKNGLFECEVDAEVYINRIYAYLIDSSVVYFPSKNQLVCKKGGGCQLRNTMGQLLFYLVRSADKGVITDDDILRNVWEMNGLSGTYSRLWQVMQNLNKKLNKLGVVDELFARTRGKGYYITEGKVVPLYIRE